MAALSQNWVQFGKNPVLVSTISADVKRVKCWTRDPSSGAHKKRGGGPPPHLLLTCHGQVEPRHRQRPPGLTCTSNSTRPFSGPMPWAFPRSSVSARPMASPGLRRVTKKPPPPYPKKYFFSLYFFILLTVLLGCTGFYWVLLGLTGFYRVLLGFYWVLPSFTEFYRVFRGFAGFHFDGMSFVWVIPSFTGFYWVLLG